MLFLIDAKFSFRLLGNANLCLHFGSPLFGIAFLRSAKKDMDGTRSTNVNESKDQWFERFFRFGLVAKGIVYCLTGVLAFMAVAGLSREKAGKTQVLGFIYDQPFGLALLIIIAAGLSGYAALRSFQAFKDIDSKGDDAKGILSRTGYGISGLLYFSLAIYAVKLIFNGQKGNGDSEEFIIAKALGYEWGPWLTGIAGIIIIGSGIYQIYRVASGKFMKKIRLSRSGMNNYVRKAGIIGYISRGIVLVIVGYLVFHAALTSNPKEAKGTEGAFTFIENKFGSLLMAIIAVGLIGYGIFMFVKAKYQRITI